MVTVDVGVYYQGFHTDSAFTIVVGESTPEQDRFLQAGLDALKRSIEVVKAGIRVGEISKATGTALSEWGVFPTRELTGHGVGRDLHEEPMIPNLLIGKIEKTPQLVVGQTIAIEIIYTSKKPSLYLEKDGWTISTRNDKLSAVFEETVQVLEDGFLILTAPSLFQMFSSGTIHKSI
jgi:methionyl aminopeptidase